MATICCQDGRCYFSSVHCRSPSDTSFHEGAKSQCNVITCHQRKVESKSSKESNRRSKGEDSKAGSSRRWDKGKRSSDALEKKGAAKNGVKESPRKKRREKTLVDLDKIVIKKR